MDRSFREKKSIRKQALSDPLDQMDLTLQHSIQKQQHTHSSEVHTEHSLELSTYWPSE